ncbi:MAG TPA: YfhO family protein [Thermoanaerobaculia bacterium]|nr:YfhO family protein [Thermoanaerobaculia bacterium]
MSERFRLSFRDAGAILLLFTLATILFGNVLFAGGQLYLRDLARYYYPTKRIVREVILGGSFPFWNPYYAAGQPMAANPEYEVFYPLQWLILIPDYNLGFRFHIVIHIYLGLAGMYALLRSMRLGIPAAFFGAFVFGLGGLFLSLVNLLPILFCVSWLPLILLFARRLFFHFRWRDLALGGIVTGLQILTAEPTTLIQTWLLVGCYGLYRAWYQKPFLRSLARNAFIAGALLASGLLVGAAQLIPALDLVGDSVRARPFELSLVTSWSMPYERPLELLFPHLFGHISRDRTMLYWGSVLYPNAGSPFIFNYYLGLLTVALVTGACFVRPRGGRLVLAIALGSYLLALGGNTPLFEWLHDAGIARSIRYPEKFILMGLFALIVLAAMMLDRLLAGDRELAAAAAGVVLGVAVLAGIIAVFSFTPWYTDVFARLWGRASSPNLARLVEMSRIDWIVATLKAVVLLFLLIRVRFGRPGRIWLAAALIFMVADLFPSGRQLSETMPQEFADPPAAVRSLATPAEGYRIFHEADWYGKSEEARKYFSTGPYVYWIVRNGLFPMTTATWGFNTVLERDYDKTALLPTVDLVDAMWAVSRSGRSDWAEPFMAMSNVRYRARYRPFVEERKRVRSLREAEPVVFEEIEPAPRYYLATEMVTIRDDDDFVDKLSAGKWNPRTAFVAGQGFDVGEGDVSVVSERPNRIEFDVVTGSRGFLVLSITRHKFWRAMVDGQPATLRAVNIAYQGVELAPGAHRVVLEYRNPIVVVSAIISFCTFLILVVVSMIDRRSRLYDPDADDPDRWRWRSMLPSSDGRG